MSEGRKDDNQKLRYDLIPADALREVVRVYTFGADKYDDRNWENGIKYGRVYAAAQRHLNAFWDDEALDSESKISHLAHAAWNCLSLLAYELRGMKQFDDRPKSDRFVRPMATFEGSGREVSAGFVGCDMPPHGGVNWVPQKGCAHEWSQERSGVKICVFCGKRLVRDPIFTGTQEL